jgi:hypothetical protein
METVMQDDAQLLHREPVQVRRSTRTMASIGVDRVRLTASWSQLAPRPRSRRRPHFDATDSRAYPLEGFERLDRAVKASRAAGMDVMIDIAFFAPRWAVTRGSSRGDRHAWRPSARQFSLFARAVAERYNGHFRDSADGVRPLPRVRLWTTWNEPNHRVFLRPQWERVDGTWRTASPHIYRRMHEAAYSQLKAVSGENQVLIGGLASFGDSGVGPRRGIAPLRFTRELACVDRLLRPLRRGDCRGFRALRADGFAHHPYSRDTAPHARDPSADRVQIGELDRLTTLLAELHRRGRVAKPLPLYLTEYGYETKPPDPNGLAAETLGRYLGEATFIAWLHPEVRMFPQFLLRDIGPDRSKPQASAARWGDYQTGVFGFDGKPKPAVLRGFRLPFYAELMPAVEGSQHVLAFGQVRPGGGGQRVQIERLDPVAGWVPEASLPALGAGGGQGCGDFAADAEGFYLRRAAFRGAATYRALWRRPDGAMEASLPVMVGVPGHAGPTASVVRPPPPLGSALSCDLRLRSASRSLP